MAMSQTVEEAIEQFSYETDENGIRWFKEHLVQVSSQQWNEGKARIFFEHPDLGLHPVGVFLSEAQSSKLREVSSANQKYKITLVLGKQKRDNDGARLFNYYWNCKSFEGVVEDTVKEMTPNGNYLDLNNVAIKPKDDDEVETADEVFGRLQAKETPKNGTHKTTAFDNKQLEINLAMCFKGGIDIYLAKNLEGGIPVIEKTAEELFQSLQNLRRKHELA